MENENLSLAEFRNDLLRAATHICENVENFVYQVTFLLWNFSFQNCFSNAGLKTFDQIRNPFGAELIGGSCTAVDVERYVDVSSEASLGNVISDDVCRWIFYLLARWLVKERIALGIKAFYSNLKSFKSRLVTKSLKLKLYRTVIRPIVTCASETWVLKENIIQKLLVFERKILRGIFGPTKENQTWRIKNN